VDLALAASGISGPVLQIDGAIVACLDSEGLRALARGREAGADMVPSDGAWSETEQLWHELLSPSELVRDLELARRVHRSQLPADLIRPDLEVAVRARPRIGIGGDYATVLELSDGRVYVAVSEVTGHGVASALLVTRVNAFVRERLIASPSPCELIDALDAFLCAHFDVVGLLATFFCARFDPATGVLEHAGAGHPPAIVCRAGETEELRSAVPVLGMRGLNAGACRPGTTTLQPGEAFVLYTDGVTEAGDSVHDQFGTARLGAVLRNHVPTGATATADAVLLAVDAHEPGAASDDRLVLVLRRQG